MTKLRGYAERTHPGLSRAAWHVLNPGLLLVLLLAGACVNIVAQNAPGALQTAETRGRFELNCPDVQATILSQKLIQTWRFEGSEHTIGVRGCDRQVVYVTYCRDPQDCNAFSQTGRISDLETLAP
jgi:hypothetical protein